MNAFRGIGLFPAATVVASTCGDSFGTIGPVRRLALASLLLVGCSGSVGDSVTDAAPLGDDASSDVRSIGEVGDAVPVDAIPIDAKIDGAHPGDASDSAFATDTPAAGCGEFTGDTRFTCSKDGRSRGKCVGGALGAEACARGCLRVSGGGDDVCMGTTASWSCTGTVGTEKAADGDYYLTGFGCWTDSGGAIHTDPGDNCIPSCLSKAHAAGLCDPSMDGPTCEEHVSWYTADMARFGCLARVRVTNPKTGKSVIAVVLDSGPACWVEAKVSKAILDASSRVDMELFGTTLGWGDKTTVHVVEVDAKTPLGPE